MPFFVKGLIRKCPAKAQVNKVVTCFVPLWEIAILLFT